jgi:RNA polymerase sigma factor (sigma-70 family)
LTRQCVMKSMDEVEKADFCAQIGPRLVGALSLYCGDRGVAEDLAQEAFVRLIERWDRLEITSSREAWTYRVAFNLARSSFRRLAIERRARARQPAPPRLPDEAEAVAVRTAVWDLPPRQRAVIVARFYIGLDVTETARALGCRPGTVKAHTFKAIQNLRTAGLGKDSDARPKEETDDCSI